jgi:hypothetical protein
MEFININPHKDQVKRIKDASLKAQVWNVILPSLPVTFHDPDAVRRASRLETVTLTDGSSAYRLAVPVFGSRFRTDWVK